MIIANSFTLIAFFSLIILTKSMFIRSIVSQSNFARIINRVPRSVTMCSSDSTVVSRCTEKISALLNPIKISVTSTNDDPNGSHIQIECVSEEFTGKSSLQRQRLVYKAIWDELNGGPVHAVDSIIAKSPKEVGL
mmetsp:Transcript_31748/g.43312  ORF Transcript_31748/g.43312 Transcript_31748/m.43312 type:complete len:135 (-) Transcript_31748:82-486(-)